MPQVCDIKVQKDLFTPRLGLAYRPTDDTVIRVGFSRNPQSDNAITRVGGIAQAFPQIIQITESGPNTFTPVGSVSDRRAARAAAGSVARRRAAAGGCGRDDARRRVHPRHDHVVERHVRRSSSRIRSA